MLQLMAIKPVTFPPDDPRNLCLGSQGFAIDLASEKSCNLVAHIFACMILCIEINMYMYIYILYYTCVCLYMCIQCIYSISYMSISNYIYIFMYPIWKCQREVNIQWVHDPLATGIRYDEYGSRPFSLVP